MASNLLPGDTVAFYGDLGSGKTEFVKGICTGLNVEDLVSSPTFTIVNHYDGANDVGGDIPVYHIDLYRIESVDELHEIGLEETLLQEDAIKLIEWSEHGVDVLPDKRYEVRFTTLDEENCRQIEVVIQDGVAPMFVHTEQVFSG
jgi:tRNA threonylcarbamoyladenosine biosynthesis protein TsaE